MSERSPHSVQDDVAAVREALNWLTLPDVDGDRERGLSALGRIEEQLEALRGACERAWSYGSTTLKSEDYYAIQRILDGDESSPASRWPGATAFYRSVPNQDSAPASRQD